MSRIMALARAVRAAMEAWGRVDADPSAVWRQRLRIGGMACTLLLLPLLAGAGCPAGARCIAPQIGPWRYHIVGIDLGLGNITLSEGELIDLVAKRHHDVNHACTTVFPPHAYTHPQYLWDGQIEWDNSTDHFTVTSTFYTWNGCTSGEAHYPDHWLWRRRDILAPPGTGTDWQSYCAYPGGALPDKNRGAGRCQPQAGNPISLATGNKYQRELDYQGAGPFPLQFVRHYNSQGLGDIVVPRLGRGWRHHYERQIGFVPLPGLSMAYAYRPDGRVDYFSLQDGRFVADADISNRLTRLTDAAGQTTGWRYLATDDSDQIEHYDAAGRLVAITTRTGMTQTLTHDAHGQLASVSDDFGRQLRLEYGSVPSLPTHRLIVGVTDPAGRTVRYRYRDAHLEAVTFPDPAPPAAADDPTRTYLYNEAAHTGGAHLQHALTGVIDERGVRYATYQYLPSGQAVTTEHDQGADRHTLVFNTDGSTTLTDPLGSVRSYRFQTVLGVIRNTGVSQPGGSGCGPASRELGYDAHGNVSRRTDFNGRLTSYRHDLARNLEIQRVEAAGTPEARTVSTRWHGDWRLPVQVAEPRQLTTFVYNGDQGHYCAPEAARVPWIDGGSRPIGVLCSRTEQATTDPNGGLGFDATPTGSPRTWRYTYNQYGQMLTADGPRTDAHDVTTYAYYADTTATHTQGDLQSLTNALGQMTRYTRHDAHGQVEEIVDPNGVVTTLTYDPRQRLTRRTTAGETVSLAYDAVGQLTRLTQPDGSYLAYTYDGARRLTEIADGLGHRIVYTLDAMGHRIGERTFDQDGALVRALARTYDALGRMQQYLGAP